MSMTAEGWKRTWLVIAGVSGAMGVAFGAYAAHGLEPSSKAMQLVDTASRYQMIHALALLGLAHLQRGNRAWLVAAGLLFTTGLVLFCGGLYLSGLQIASIGVLVPFGGTAFIAGWLTLAVAALRDAAATGTPPRPGV